MSPGPEAPEVSPRLASTAKMMITLFWNTSDLYVSDFLAGESFNADYFVRSIMHRIHLLPIFRSRINKTMIRLGYGQCSDPPFKSDKSEIVSDASAFRSASSVFTRSGSIGFFLFRYFKEKLLGREFESAEALLDWIRDELESIRPNVLERVCESWITRVGKCLQHEGAYFSED
jgi:hypothetical protein